LGERGPQYYFITNDKTAALRTRTRELLNANEREEEGADWIIEFINKICTDAASTVPAYIRLPPGSARSWPQVLRVKRDGSVWLANDDGDVLKVGQLPAKPASEASCVFDYVADVIARARAARARVGGAYVRVLWRPAASGNPAAIFHFSLSLGTEIIVASIG